MNKENNAIFKPFEKYRFIHGKCACVVFTLRVVHHACDVSEIQGVNTITEAENFKHLSVKRLCCAENLQHQVG